MSRNTPLSQNTGSIKQMLPPIDFSPQNASLIRLQVLLSSMKRLVMIILGSAG